MVYAKLLFMNEHQSVVVYRQDSLTSWKRSFKTKQKSSFKTEEHKFNLDSILFLGFIKYSFKFIGKTK